jgi:hypothetical protein
MEAMARTQAEGTIMKTLRTLLVTLALTAGLLLLTGITASSFIAFAAEPMERFTATAVNLSGVGRAGSGIVEIMVDRWSTDAERERLLTTLLEKGPDALFEKLQDTPAVGRIRTPTSLGWDLHYARSIDKPDRSRQVVIATDRPMGFREAVNQGRSTQYKFTVIDIRFDADGKGVGKLGYATKITVNKESNTIELENFGIEPIRLTEVRSDRWPPKKSN